MNKLFKIVSCTAAAMFILAGCIRDRYDDVLFDDSPVTIVLDIDESKFTTTRAGNVNNTTDGTIDIINSLEVQLTAGNGGFTWKRIDPVTNANDTIITIYNVINPIKLEVRANGGKESYSNLGEELNYKKDENWDQ